MRQWRGAVVSLALVIAAGPARADALDAEVGRALFKRQWVPAPSSTDSSNGLGPLFNARACASCHARGCGARVVRGATGDDIVGAVVRFADAHGKSDPYYGSQLQTAAVPGLAAEGHASFLPKLSLTLAGPPLAEAITPSVRIAPSLLGRAWFDDVTDAEILKREDPDDLDHDGITGRANRIGGAGGLIGRFGWKALHASVRDQIAHAFMLDLGLSSTREPHPWGDCTAKEASCLAAPTGRSPASDGEEISSKIIDLIAAYLMSLKAAPSPVSMHGERLFAGSGCAACHVPRLLDKSGVSHAAFTDLLLHDMGPDLDDGAGEGLVPSSQWRTAPLTGRTGQPPGRYLHDGSAATIVEAIAKHGGEAARSRDKFNALSLKDRAALIAYVGRL